MKNLCTEESLTYQKKQRENLEKKNGEKDCFLCSAARSGPPLAVQQQFACLSAVFPLYPLQTPLRSYFLQQFFLVFTEEFFTCFATVNFPTRPYGAPAAYYMIFAAGKYSTHRVSCKMICKYSILFLYLQYVLYLT